jgi:hypothetical protein
MLRKQLMIKIVGWNFDELHCKFEIEQFKGGSIGFNMFGLKEERIEDLKPF